MRSMIATLLCCCLLFASVVIARCEPANSIKSETKEEKTCPFVIEISTAYSEIDGVTQEV